MSNLNKESSGKKRPLNRKRFPRVEDEMFESLIAEFLSLFSSHGNQLPPAKKNRRKLSQKRFPTIVER